MVSLPYITAPGNIDKALIGIKSATVPPKVTQDFVKTILKVPGGSGDQMTAYLKKIGFTAPTGEPSDLYRKFRNPTSAGPAVAAAIRFGYAPLYKRNEFMHELSDDDLLGLIVEETGQPLESYAVRNAASCIKHLMKHADFKVSAVEHNTAAHLPQPVPLPTTDKRDRAEKGFGLNLGYTTNLNLPATADPQVFDAIFKSLKQHLLRDDDA
jgi:hypothetical protein